MSQFTKTVKQFGMIGMIAGALACATAANADVINIFGDTNNSTEGIGDFEGTISYEAKKHDEGLLTIELTNTSQCEDSLWITGFVFNIDSSDHHAEADLDDADYHFKGVEDEKAQPFGKHFDAGAALKGNWEGGGDPKDGIDIGDSGTFTFEIEADDAEDLMASSFINGPYDFNFIVRFRGGDCGEGGSDKVPGSVPSPASLAIMLVGAATMGGRGKRRRA
ncbi:MAG: hypothetical protein D8M59_07165 [Planctomycetes bacterium]|nr:hypothetical protein [Planctomycetota bacterium]NOG53820.1 hypothetical protein [Planctomycetota bacterium]